MLGLRQFSVENPQRVKTFTPKPRDPRTTVIAVSKPFLCPSIGFKPWLFAHLRLPSGIITTCFGKIFSEDLLSILTWIYPSEYQNYSFFTTFLHYFCVIPRTVLRRSALISP